MSSDTATGEEIVLSTADRPAPRPRKRRSATSTAPARGWPVTPWIFLLVPLALLITFGYVPVANMFWYSVTDWNGVSKVKNFVGMDNYVEFFTRPELFGVFRVSLYYLAASIIQMSLALYFATILSFSTRFKNLFKGILFFPYLINGVAISFIFLFFFQPAGTLDSVLGLLGISQDSLPLWLGDPAIINFSLAGTSVWRYTGLNFVLFLGAIQSIPGQIYEAADLDGASRWNQFRYIIAPSIKPIISLSFILAVSGSLSVFEIPFIMTDGANGSATFVIQTVKTAFNNNKVGLASAMAVVLLVIVLVVTWIQRMLVPDEKVDIA
ncbi:sugar ABC transporter permease [Tessaracoccus antarcticus]|uniref:Sugar ABC transporter permease n=1 Tax=Tessaracoccus antarcticus TaxID=2479848 RepID=A0A3M0G292_9ACTN|nr:sugar ABC transporter permease [Tessaracoccus antarcticus]